MTIRNLDRAFAPRSLAIFGASDRPGRTGAYVLANVLAAGFAGPVYPINPKYSDVSGLKCYTRVADLPDVPDLSVIVTPATTVARLVDELGAFGGRSAVIVSAGLSTPEAKTELLQAAGRWGVRLIGPNTIGILLPRCKLNASFTHVSARAGKLGLISQSGAIISAIVDWAEAEGVGFSKVISLGDMLDVDVGDCLNFLAQDAETSAILMYVEAISNARKFMSAARAAARLKPVISVKPGRHEQAARAATTHTGALAQADSVIDAALRRAGIVRVDDLEDLFLAAEVTARFRPLKTARVGIVTNGGGAGVLAVDHLLDRGVELATLSRATLEDLDKALPTTWSRANPVDIIGDAPPDRYVRALQAVASDEAVDAVLVMNCPTALAEPTAAAQAIAAASSGGLVGGKPLLATWLGQFAAEKARKILNEAGIASLDTPKQAAAGISMLVRWRALLAQLQRVPSSSETLGVDRSKAMAVISAALANEQTMLTEPQAKSVLDAYGIAVPRTVFAADEEAVRKAAAELLSVPGEQIAIKLVSSSLTHKSDVGGVVLNVKTASEARDAARRISKTLSASNLQAHLEGFSVQQMVIRPNAHELLVGVATDPLFGPVLMFGAGGTAVEVLQDTTTELLPVDDVLAQDMIARTRISRLLAGYRNRAPANQAAIVTVLKAVSQMLIDIPQITALDINPLLVDERGAIALDARIQIDPSRKAMEPPNQSLSIRPYPAAWTKTVHLAGGAYAVRAIRPNDVSLYPAFLARITPEDMRLRFLVPTATLSDEQLIRLTQIDYDRDIAFIALDRSGDLAGIVRYASEPDRISAEFGLLVRSDLKGHGLGQALMEQLIAYGLENGLSRLTGLVLRENDRMLALGKTLGMTVMDTGDREAVTLTLALTDKKAGTTEA
jgi:acetyltransferase